MALAQDPISSPSAPDKAVSSGAPASLGLLAPFARLLLEKLRAQRDQPEFTFQAEGERFALPRAQAEKVLERIALLKSPAISKKQDLVSLASAADQLDITEEYFIRLMKAKRLRFRKGPDGTRLVTEKALQACREKLYQDRVEMLAEMAQWSQEMGLYG
jgi:hypothetical protein